ncbi:putative zinc metalloproteinase, partial [Stegodyphus mimosarum]
MIAEKILLISSRKIPYDIDRCTSSECVDAVLFGRNMTRAKAVFIYKIKVLYDTCMDEQSIEKEGSKPLKNILKELGGWPLLEDTDWNEKAFDWVKTLIRFRELGYSHSILFEVSVTDDPWDSSATIIKLDQPLFGTDRKELLANEVFTKPYAELMKEVVYYFRFEDRSTVEIDRVRNEMENMLKFENILA